MATGNASSLPALGEPSEHELRHLQTLIRRVRDALSEARMACALVAASSRSKPLQPIEFVSTTLEHAAQQVDLAELEMTASGRDRRRRCSCAQDQGGPRA